MSIEALSLACNIMAVIEFGHTFYEVFRDIYNNGRTDGAAEQAASELSQLTARLKNSREQAEKSLPKDDQLMRVADQCFHVTTKLQREMAKLTLPSDSSSTTSRYWHSFKSTTKRTWRRDRIEELKKSMEGCQRTMQSAILVELYQSGQAQQVMHQEGFSRLETRLQTFILAVAKQGLEHSQLSSAENRALHQETQLVMRQEVAALKSEQDSELNISRLRASLKFPGLNQRYNEVNECHKKSFHWLLGDTTESSTGEQESIGGRGHSYEDRIPKDIQDGRDRTFNDFSQWLKTDSDSSLYWISGRAGSGKSTLMKFLCQQMERQNILGESHIVLYHFFWLGLSQTRSWQNDLKGMFSALLYQLLGAEVDIEPPLTTTLSQRIPQIRQKDSESDWSLEELRKATWEALKAFCDHSPVYILLDALDEHLPTADHDELLATIRKLEHCPKVRLVVSSRREPIFERHLKLFRQLQLEHLTGPDIHAFALESLRKTLRSALITDYSVLLMRQLAGMIARKARGVFLWARLAVDSVKRGLIDRNSASVLRERLDDMPLELFDFFKSIWKRLGNDEKRYQTQAANVFSLLLCDACINDSCIYVPHDLMGPDLLTISLALAPDDACALVKGADDVDETGLLERCRQVQGMISSHCAGFIEFSPDSAILDNCVQFSSGLPDPNKKCSFIHRTATEFFLETAEGKRIVDSNNFGKDGPGFRLMQAFLGRAVAFRKFGHVESCRLMKPIRMGCWFGSALALSRIGAHFSQEQRYSLLALCHTAFNRYPDICSGCLPSQELMPTHKWGLSNPFVILAAFGGHADYAAYWIKDRICSGQIFTPEAFDVVLKNSLMGYFSRLFGYLGGEGGDWITEHFTSAWLSPPMSYYLSDFDSLLHSVNKLGIRLPRSNLALDSNIEFSEWDECRQLFSTSQLVLSVLLRLLLELHIDKDTARELSNSPQVVAQGGLVKLIHEMVPRLLDILAKSDARLHERITCVLEIQTKTTKGVSSTTGNMIRGLLMRFPCISPKLSLRDRRDRSYQVHILVEMSPLWALQWIAWNEMALNPSHDITRNLRDFVQSRTQDWQSLQRPRPILLFLSSPLSSSIGPGDMILDWDLSFEPIMVERVPLEMEDYLIEPLLRAPCFDNIETQWRDCLETLMERVQEAWTAPSAIRLQEHEVDEALVTHGVWCQE